MKTYYADFTITVVVEAENMQEAMEKLDSMSNEEVAKDGDWASSYVLMNEDFEEIEAE